MAVDRRARRLARRRARNRAVLAVTAAVLVAGGAVAAVTLSGATRSGSTTATTHPSSPRRTSTSTTPHPAKSDAISPTDTKTFLGPDGVEASWVVAENKLPGTTAWRITGAPANSTIAGFANRVEARAGQTVTFYVSSDAPTFRVEAFRMGWYQGTGAHLVWTSAELPGHVQPPCPVTPGVNMVACDNWTRSFTVPITSAFVEGDYLFKLIGSGNQQSYVPLTVWDPAAHAAYLIKNDVFTWQAWNPYGGYDYYVGQGACPPVHYPLCSRARVVSFDRPYGSGNGAGDFLGNELPLVEFAEEHGLDVAYGTDLLLVQHPSYLSHVTSLLSLGHDECWSYRERLALDAAHAKGMNVIFFAASPILRHVRLQASPLGPDREEVDYRNALKDPLYGHGNPLRVTGNTWASPPASWPETSLVGEMYNGFLEPGQTAPFVVHDAVPWLFAGTGLHDGSSIPGVIASDFDQFDPSWPHPADVQILGHSPIPLTRAQASLDNFNGVSYSDLTYWTDPTSGAGVFDSGTNNWINALNPCPAGTSCPAPLVRRITGNLLRLFGQGPTGHLEPSVANWQTIVPAGS